MRKRLIQDRIDIFRYESGFLNHRIALGLIISGFAIGIMGYVILEDYTFREAFYMTTITISTVGFSEVKPLSPPGQLFTTILIFLNVGIFAYSISTFSSLVIEGELFKRLHLRTIERHIMQLKNHIIVCGYGRYGREIVASLLAQKIPFIVIDRSPDRIQELQASEHKILYLHMDVTSDEALENARIDHARALVTTLSDDIENLFTVLSARQLNSNINIISSCKERKTERKLKKAGANHIIMPDRLGGAYMATLISKPGTVEFFSFISNQFESDIGFEELMYDKLPAFCHQKSISDLQIQEKTGANIIGMKRKDGSFEINPAPESVLQPGSSYIVLGSEPQLLKLQKLLAGMANAQS